MITPFPPRFLLSDCCVQQQSTEIVGEAEISGISKQRSQLKATREKKTQRRIMGSNSSPAPPAHLRDREARASVCGHLEEGSDPVIVR